MAVSVCTVTPSYLSGGEPEGSQDLTVVVTFARALMRQLSTSRGGNATMRRNPYKRNRTLPKFEHDTSLCFTDAGAEMVMQENIAFENCDWVRPSVAAKEYGIPSHFVYQLIDDGDIGVLQFDPDKKRCFVSVAQVGFVLRRKFGIFFE